MFYYILTLIFLACSLILNRSAFNYLAFFSFYLMLKAGQTIFEGKDEVEPRLAIKTILFAHMIPLLLSVGLSKLYSHFYPGISPVAKNYLGKMTNPYDIFDYLLGVLFYAPIMEEVLYRRFLIGYFRDKGMNVILLSAMSIILFVLIHIKSDELYSLVVVGEYFVRMLPGAIALTIVYLRYGLLMSIITHLFFNIIPTIGGDLSLWLYGILLVYLAVAKFLNTEFAR